MFVVVAMLLMSMMHQRLIASLTTINASHNKEIDVLLCVVMWCDVSHVSVINTKEKIRSTLFRFESPSRKPHVEATCQQGQCCRTSSAAFAAYCAKFSNCLEKSRQVCAMQLLAATEARKEGNLQ